MEQSMKAGDSRIRLALIPLAQAAVITAAVLAALCPVSCSLTEEGIRISDGDYTSPVINAFYITGADSAQIRFSKEVYMKASSVSLVGGTDSGRVAVETVYEEPDCASGADSERECAVDFHFSEPFETGAECQLYGEAEDAAGNTLTFLLPFQGYNDDVPSVVMSEIHPMYTASTLKSGKVYKCEFVELFALSDGNLSGLELYSAYDGDSKAFRLPAVRVKAGEYVVVHLRSAGDGCVSELGDDLTLSTAKYSCDTARDIWSGNGKARLGDNDDVILLRNPADGKILDAVLYAPSGAAAWKNDSLAAAAALAAEAGLWSPDADVRNAACSDGMTASRTLVRSAVAENNGASAWSVADSKNVTPGYAAR